MMICVACGPAPEVGPSGSGGSQIVALLDDDPRAIDLGKTAAIRFVIKEPVPEGYSLGQVLTANTAAHNITLTKGTVIGLDCMLSAYKTRWCEVEIIATPTPQASE
ncbi:MAG: hypothetical protein UZ21_OP11001000637 [Microgenomates bacterium OLB22]|nr:MAG: hypothetical protein UZ21_OP11001000637 [Microgenomates bacterium OLB22]